MHNSLLKYITFSYTISMLIRCYTIADKNLFNTYVQLQAQKSDRHFFTIIDPSTKYIGLFTGFTFERLFRHYFNIRNMHHARYRCKISQGIVKLTNLVVLAHPPPRFCRVPRTRTILFGGFGCPLPMRLILNRYLVDSTKTDEKSE